jgi:hypothetical protein
LQIDALQARKESSGPHLASLHDQKGAIDKQLQAVAAQELSRRRRAPSVSGSSASSASIGGPTAVPAISAGDVLTVCLDLVQSGGRPDVEELFELVL